MNKTLYTQAKSGELLAGVIPRTDVTEIVEAATSQTKTSAVILKRRGGRSLGIQQYADSGEYSITTEKGQILESKDLLELRGSVLQLQGITDTCREQISYSGQWLQETSKLEKGILLLLLSLAALSAVTMPLYITLIASLAFIILSTVTLFRVYRSRNKSVVWGKQPEVTRNQSLSVYAKYLLTKIYADANTVTSPASFNKSQFLYDVTAAEAKIAKLISHPAKEPLARAGVATLLMLEQNAASIEEKNWRGSEFQRKIYDNILL